MKFLIAVIILISAHLNAYGSNAIEIQSELQNADHASDAINLLQCLSEKQINWSLVNAHQESSQWLILRDQQEEISVELKWDNKNYKKTIKSSELLSYCNELADKINVVNNISLSKLGTTENSTDFSRPFPTEDISPEQNIGFFKKYWLPMSILAAASTSYIYLKSRNPGTKGLAIVP